MALTDFEKLFIADYSMRLLQQDILTNTYFMGGTVGEALRNMHLPKAQVKTFTDPMAEALTGRLRADAAALRQAAANVDEAASIFGILSSATKSIKGKMERMVKILDEIDAGTMLVAPGEAEYKSLQGEIALITQRTSYNGISLMSATAWAGDSRVDDSVTGVGKLHIQSSPNASGGFAITFYDLDGILAGTDVTSFGDEDQRKAARSALIAADTGQLPKVESYLDVYSNRKAQMELHSSSLADQAAIIENAVKTRRDGLKSAEQLLIDYLLGAIGTIIDANS